MAIVAFEVGDMTNTRRLAIIGAYVALFWGLLPAGLWTFGSWLDTLLALPRLAPAWRWA